MGVVTIVPEVSPPSSPASPLSQPSLRQRALIWPLLGVGFLLLAARATLAPLWFDELLTLYVSKFESLPDLWHALEQAADGNPPLLYLLTRSSHVLFGESALGTRLPSLVAFLVASAAFYAWITERLGKVYGVLGVALLWASPLARYSYEARPYAWMVAWAAVSLLSWRRAVERRDGRFWYLAGLGAVVACTLANHYYGVFALLPVAAGEITRLIRRKKPDWGIWAASCAGAASGLIYLPLIRAVSEAHSGGFWRPVMEIDVISFYLFFAYGPAGGALLSIYVYLLVRTRGGGAAQAAPVAGRSPFPPEERIAMWAFAVSPTMIAVLAMLTTETYVMRYALPAVLGLVWGILMMVWRSARGAERPAWIALAITAAMFFAYHGNGVVRLARTASSNETLDRTFAALDQSASLAEPVVVASPFTYLRMWHRAPPRWKKGLVLITDPDVSRLMKGCNTGDISLVLLEPWAGLSVVDRREFLEQHDRFVVLTAKPPGDFSWLNDYLDARRAENETVIETPDFVLKEYRDLRLETPVELAALAPAEPLCR